ncbi:MAG TPA: hypothetical protein VN578_12110, partial [Candidatus Binatia bacterium]|nr:hypothetical protein [Candidatus Binatia bacterium]
MKKLYSVRTIILAGSLLLQLSALCFHARGAAGDVDLSFDPGSGVNDTVNAFAVQSDGKVIIGGSFTTVKGLARQSIARLNADGSGDATFNAGTVTDRYLSAITLQTDGKIIFIRDSYNVTGAPPGYKVARLNSDGSLDNSFVPALGFFPYGSGFTCVAVQPDGKVVLGGYFTDHYVDEYGFEYFYRRSLLVRLNANGSSDNNFTNSIGNFGAWIHAIALQSDGRILIGGEIATTANGTNRYDIARLNADGSVDSSFTPGAGGQAVRSIAVQSNGKSLIGGYYLGNGTNRNGVIRLNVDGGQDATFHPATDADSAVALLLIQPDNKVLLGGPYFYFNGTNRHGVARLNPDGSVDNSFSGFNPGTGVPDNAMAAFALQSDGKLFIGGGFTTVNGVNRERVARLNIDGSLDGNFAPGSAISAGIRDIAVQVDGKVLIGGAYTVVPGVGANAIARRLNSNGSLDGSFDPYVSGSSDPYNPYVSPGISAVIAQTGGKVLIGGDFSSVNGTNRNGIARLNANGTLDNSFIPGIGSPTGYSLAVATLVVQTDGKILVGGRAYGTNQNSIARLNTNGTLDSGFHPDTMRTVGTDYWIYFNSVVIQPDGKILAGGGAANDDLYGPLIMRLNADGSYDTNFNATLGGAWVSSIVLQPDG